jgi:UDP-2-acetamido-2-deoxy-ribo-hexuluronate aminotransferase
LFGYMPDYSALRFVIDEAERKFGTSIALVEDGAQSFGAMRNGFLSCNSPHTTLATTSFFPSKTLGCYGDGGAVFTRDARLATIVASLRSHGKDGVSGLHTRIGLNGRLDAIQAAVVLAKLDHLDTMIDKRIRIANAYTRAFQTDRRIVVPSTPNPEEVRHAYGVYTIRVPQRDEVAQFLKGRGVACGIYYPVCVHQQPVFQKFETAGARVILPVAEHISAQVISLPIHAFLNDQEQKYVIATTIEALNSLGVTGMPLTKEQLKSY